MKARTAKRTRRSQRKIAFSFATFLLLLLVIFLCAKVRPKDFGPILVAANESAVRSGGPLTLIGLADGTVDKPNLAALGCDGAAVEPTERKIYFSCRVGVHQLISYDPVTQSADLAEDIALGQNNSFRIPLACDKYSTCYGAVGSISQDGNSGGKLIIYEGGRKLTEVPFPNQTRNQVPMRLVVYENDLWLLTRGPTGMPAEVLRFDRVAKQFATQEVFLNADAWDIAVNDNVVAVSVFRPIAGADINIYDKSDLHLKKSLKVDGDVPNSFNAFGLALRQGSLYVAGSTGVSKFSLEGDMAKTGFLGTQSFTYESTMGPSSYFVSLPELDKVIEIDLETLEIKREYAVTVGTGRIFILESQDPQLTVQ